MSSAAVEAMGYCKKFRQTGPAAWIEEIGECIAVQYGEKSIQGFRQDGLELANRHDRTSVCSHVETLHHLQVGFGVPHDVSQLDLIRFASERHTAGAAGIHRNIAMLTQGLNDSYEMML